MDYFRLKKKMLMSITHKIKGFVRRVSGTDSVKLADCAGGDWLDLDISGNSLQNGTPTPDAPVEVQSVGDLVTDTTDANYGKYKIPVVVKGKNLATAQQVCNTFAQYGEIMIDDRECIRYHNQGRYTDFPYKENTQYTITFDYKVTQRSSAALDPATEVLFFFYSDGTKGATASRDAITSHEMDVWKKGTMTSRAGKTVVAIGVPGNFYKNWINIDVNTFQIEEGATATEYEPYFKQTTNMYLNQPLRKVGVYADYIDFKNNKVVRNIGVGTSNSLSIWREQSNSYNCGITWGLPNCNYKANIALCTHLNYLTASNGVYFQFIDGIYWFFDKTLFPTKADADSWITSRKADEIPLRFHYVLITPTEEPLNIDLPQLPNQTTIVEIDTQLAPTETQVEYYSNVKGEIE